MSSKLEKASTKSAFTDKAVTALTQAIRAELRGQRIDLGPDSKPATPAPNAE